MGTRNITCLPSAAALNARAQRHLGLAVADVAADQAVHRPRLLHVRLDLLDRVELVRRLAVRERVLEVELPLAVGRERVTGAPLALRVEVDQLARQRLRGAPGAQLHLLPGLAAELRQRRVARARADVAGDLVELVARHEDAVAVLVLELEVVARHAADRLRLEAGEAGDAVVLVNDRVAGPEVGERRDRGAAAGARPGPALRRAAAAQQPVLRARWRASGRAPGSPRAAQPPRTTRRARRPAARPSRNSARSRARLYAARSASPRRPQVTTVR